jgi:hypothetical protein
MHISSGGLFCKLLNSYEPDPATAPRTERGVGLQNVQKRLNLLYPGKHHFSTIASNEVFIVSLDLQWDDSKIAALPHNPEKAPYAVEMPVGG